MADGPAAGEPDADEAVRANLVWHALTGPQRPMATFSTNGAAARFDPEVSPFCAVERPDAPDWDALAEIAEGPGFVLLAGTTEITAPTGWTTLFEETGTQYIAGDLVAPPALPEHLQMRELTADDATAMVELTALTEPGPFAERTHELGRYLGIFDGDRLVAMAGERLRSERWWEVSAVCTHPDAQRQGLGALLTLEVAAAIRASGREALLHVRAGNDPAHALYRKIGFESAGDFHFAVFAPER